MSGAKQITSPWSPWVLGIVASLMTVVAVNIIMVVFAVRSSKGTFESNPYEQGMNYQSTIEQRRVIDRMGWKVDLRMVRDEAHRGVIKLRVLDSHGGVGGLGIRAEVRRPSDSTFDRSCTLSEAEAGVYLCNLDLLPIGLYFVTAWLGKDGRFDTQVILY